MIARNSIVQLEKMFRFQWEEAQQCYVLLYPEGMIKLNGPAGEILSLVNGERSVADIIDQLNTKYPDAGGVDDDVLAFAVDAVKQHWIRVLPSSAS